MRIRASAVCVWRDRILTVGAVDPVSGRRYLFLPGGAIEAGEAAAAAAERETREETGYAVRVEAADVVREYTFEWAGSPVLCRTTFCRAARAEPIAGPEPVRDADYLRAAEWVDLERVDEVFAYHAVVREAVRAVLGSG